MARPPKSVMKKIIALAAFALLATATSVPLPEEERDAPLPHKPLDWMHHVKTAGKGKGFKEMYRLPIASFYELLNGDGKTWPGLRRAINVRAVGKKHNWRVYKGQTVPAEVRLAVTLRWLAGGACQWQDLRTAYGCSKAELFKTFWLVIDVINANLHNVHFPIDDSTELAKMESLFRAKSRKGGWRGQVGAVDGCILRTHNPGDAVPASKTWYVARKGCFGILLQAIADADRRIRWYDMNSVPTSHDSSAFTRTDLGQRIVNGDLPAPFFLSGDNAYKNGPSLVTPGVGSKYYHFNFEHSSLRMPIEQAFGELVARWGILWRPLRMKHKRRAIVIACLVRLHNWCIDHRIKSEFNEVNGMVLGPTGRWVPAPRFDRDGRPVEYLDTHTESQMDLHPDARRDALLE
jgi:hypothetical protein